VNFHRTVELLFGAAVVTGLYGVFTPGWTRVTRATVRLANLPAGGAGEQRADQRCAPGHVRNGGFLGAWLRKILKEGPDAILIAGRFVRRHGHPTRGERLSISRLVRRMAWYSSREIMSNSGTTANT